MNHRERNDGRTVGATRRVAAENGETLDVAALKNIGPKTAAWLRDLGIRTAGDLARIGSVEAYRRLRASGRGATLVALYALEGALWNTHWNELPPELKASLKKQAEQFEPGPEPEPEPKSEPGT